MGRFVSPHMGGTSAGGQSVNGGTHEGGHRPYRRGPNFDRLHHKLKVLLLLSCNYMVQYLSTTILLKLVDLYLIAFKFIQ